MGDVMEITFSLVPRNIPKMSPESFQKRIQNPYKRASGGFRKHGLKTDVEKESHVWKCCPKWIQNLMKNDEKADLGTLAPPRLICTIPESSGGTPPDENVPKTTDTSCGKKRAAGKREGPMLQETSLCAAGWAKPIWINCSLVFEWF